MFEADAEMAKLKYLPGIDYLTEKYRTHVQAVAESYRAAGLANAAQKAEQVQSRWKMARTAFFHYRHRRRVRPEKTTGSTRQKGCKFEGKKMK